MNADNKNDVPVVSVIMPCFNSERYVQCAIKSVQSQTYKKWEILAVDDASTDGTWRALNTIARGDRRVRPIRLSQNSGAAEARNRALSIARGRFIAYLDADDLWLSEKLQIQLDYMVTRSIGFSCTSYEVVDAEGHSLNKTVEMLATVDYTGFLTNNLLQTVGVMVDTEIVDRQLLQMPNLRRRQDAATWLQILKSGHDCYGVPHALGRYRRVQGSLSANKARAAMGVWRLYREVEGLSFSFSAYCFVRYAALAIRKRSYRWRISNIRL